MYSIPANIQDITREFLLSKNTEETYMSTYLRIPVKKGLQVSPLRKDTKPTVSFYRNKNNILKYHDFGTGFTADFVGIVMEIYRCDYRNALRIIAEDFHYIDKTSDRPEVKIRVNEEVLEEKSDTIIQITPKDFTPTELRWWESFGVSYNTLKKFKVFSCDSVFLNGNYFGSSSAFSPMYGYYCGKKQGKELWRIYIPKRKSFRFLSNTGKTYIQGIKQIPKEGDLLVITKSLKDTMCFYEFGINALAPCSEVLFISPSQLKKLKESFKKIIVFYDNDLAGIAGMKKIKKDNPELDFFFIPRKYGAKDFSDFIKKYGKSKTKEYLNEVLKYYGQKEIG